MPVLAPDTTRLKQEIASARRASDLLFNILRTNALFERPIDQRHRVIFYIGHLDGFDSIQICREGLGIQSPDPAFDTLFQAGIDPDSSSLPSDSKEDWPTLDQVRQYVDRCREHVDRHIEYAPEDTVQMALEHRLMHLETLAYMFHNLDHSFKQNDTDVALPPTGQKHSNTWREIPRGDAVLGKPKDGSFGWDNEYSQVRLDVPGFRMQRFNVTNGEYLEFVKEGAQAPHFWKSVNGAYHYRGMFQDLPLPLDWPVYVTEQQAELYARWIGKQLPTEEQFHRAAYGTRSGQINSYPWGSAEPRHVHGNFDFRRWDPEPVTATPSGDSEFGISQLVGNGWEWTQTVFAPLPDFQPRSSYPGYSANFFDGQHNVIKGGSSRTAARLLRASFRNWFRRDYPYVYAAFRCVEN